MTKYDIAILLYPVATLQSQMYVSVDVRGSARPK